MKAAWHIYWLAPEDLESFGAACASINGAKRSPENGRDALEPAQAKGPVCSVLRPRQRHPNRVLYAQPKSWTTHCARQVSFYGDSDKHGQVLAASPKPIPAAAKWKTAELVATAVPIPRAATEDEIDLLTKDPAFAERAPRQWFQLGPLEKRLMVRSAARLGYQAEDADQLLRVQAANHANFLRNTPVLSADGAPHSVAPSGAVCAACLQLFGILGSQHKKLLVAPCPGAVSVARLPPDQLLEVRRD